jgi:hypothetical protein
MKIKCTAQLSGHREDFPLLLLFKDNAEMGSYPEMVYHYGVNNFREEFRLASR